MTRQKTLEAIKANPDISVLIVGGGVNGIGTFRDLALQGVDVTLVEMADFCSGASAASSHMVHGGLRYLENAEFRLVKEALTERNRLLQNAPHMVKPLPTTIPIFTWFSGILNAPLKFLNLMDKPSERGALVIKAGLTMYDLFTWTQQTLPQHKFQSKDAALRKRPMLNSDIIATATYYDAWMPYPERICVDMVLDAEAANPNAHAVNYVKAIAAAGDTVTLRDEVTGETFQLRPRIIINAAGPWIDFANQNMDRKTRFIGGTKGSHILVDHPELHQALHGQELFFENDDGRIVLIFPLKDRVIIGTTDIRIDDPDEAVCTEEEVDYMLNLVKHVFPKMELDRSHIVYRFSGVRPLPASDANTTGQISRDHSIKAVEAGNGVNFPILSLVGGKWTTFRAFSEEVANEVLERLGRNRYHRTVNTPIGGGKDYPTENAEQWLADHAETMRIKPQRLALLLDRYGTRALEIAEMMNDGDDMPLESNSDYTRSEILYLAAREKIVHLDDLLMRRSLLAMLGKVTGVLLVEVADILGAALIWSEEEKQAEIERARHLLIEKHGVSEDMLQPSVATPA